MANDSRLFDCYNLEYNEKDGLFHYANVGYCNKNISKDWKTVCTKISENNCNEFTQFIYDKYTKIDATYKEVMQEFVQFLTN